TPLSPPPRSTHFPYTTLFRSVPSAAVETVVAPLAFDGFAGAGAEDDLLLERKVLRGDRTGGGEPSRVVHIVDRNPGHRQPVRVRSEEHTSELQSREKLVCRLL